jgi:uncharacterized repeat protein (TIGR01451 family)
MTKARIFTTAGLIHLTIAALLALTFLFGQPTTASGSALGFTPTSTSPPPEPSLTPTPTGGDEKPSCHLTITKKANPTEVLPGDTVTIVIEACNVGDATCEDVVVSDALPSELEVISASASQGQAVIEGNGVRAEFGDLPPGACATLTIVARVRDDVPLCTQFTNVSTIGDLVSNVVTLTVPCPLPESGKTTTLTVVAALLAVGVSLLATGLAMRARNQAVRATVEDR